MPRKTEAEIADAVVAVLHGRPNGEAQIADLIDAIPSHIALSPEDLADSPTRPGEPVWHQQVRNITSHKGSPGNAIHDGRLVAVKGGLRLALRAA